MTRESLERPTLVLNRHWQPVRVTTLVRALVMVWNDSARVVQPDEYRLYTWEDWSRRTPPPDAPWIQTSRSRLAVPEVICLTRYDRLPATAVAFSRRNVARRDHYLCQYCGDQPGRDRITIDHVVPRSQGGATSWTNCAAACAPCNARKADRTPEQAGMRLRRRPVRPTWKPQYAATHGPIPSWSRFLADGPVLALA